MIVASSSCLKRSVGTIQMRCLAKILSLIPTTAVQSALKSAVVSSLQCQARFTEHGAESALAAQLVPGLGLPALGSSCGRVRRSSPRCLHGEAVLVPKLGGTVCSGEHVAPLSPAGPGQQSHTTATRNRPGKGIGLPELKQYYVLGITEE